MNFRGKIILAPMAGVTDPVFRALCRRHGADIVVSEMVSADGLHYQSEATAGLLRLAPEERPAGVQLFGADPARLAEAAAQAEELARPDFIDLNAGCPVRKVVRRNGGAALLKDQALFGRIVEAMVRAVRTPVTVKLRSGWTTGQWVDTEFARIAEQAGAAAVTLHPRSAVMLYSGHSFWERIAAVRQTIRIPLIGNGDIVHPEDAAAMMKATGCDSVMIGRASLGNPWIFAQCRAVLDGRPVCAVTPAERLQTALEHLRMHAGHHGERRAAAEMKRQLAWYTRGLTGGNAARREIFRAQTLAELREIMERLIEAVGVRGCSRAGSDGPDVGK